MKASKKVRHSFTDAELQEMATSSVPYAVQVRNVLNAVGFKFEDDGKWGLIINHEPRPVGALKCWRDESTGATTYEQIIPDKGCNAGCMARNN